MPVNDCENNCTLKTRVDRLEKDFEAEVVAAIITGAIGYLLASIGIG